MNISSGFPSKEKHFLKDLLQAIRVTTLFVLQLRTLSTLRDNIIFVLHVKYVVGNQKDFSVVWCIKVLYEKEGYVCSIVKMCIAVLAVFQP